MNTHEIFMNRCIEIATNGLRSVAPNPMVGSVVVYQEKIIGEGFHREFGGPHAEVNAINSVINKEQLKDATLYVSLEPCSHQGKTPPCADLIISKGIPRVVIGTTDPNPLISGKGIQLLKSAGIEVIVGIQEKECAALNKRFFTFHQKNKPYVILKWAQSLDGFMDIDRENSPNDSNWITNEALKRRVHLWRSQEQAILIGFRTASNDNPKLTVRLTTGKNPLRVVYDPKNELPASLNVFDGSQDTLVIAHQHSNPIKDKVEYALISEQDDECKSILNVLYKKGIQSVIIEGGRKTLNKFIKSNLWDEAFVLIGNKTFTSGLKAPSMHRIPEYIENVDSDKVIFYKNQSECKA